MTIHTFPETEPVLTDSELLQQALDEAIAHRGEDKYALVHAQRQARKVAALATVANDDEPTCLERQGAYSVCEMSGRPILDCRYC